VSEPIRRRGTDRMTVVGGGRDAEDLSGPLTPDAERELMRRLVAGDEQAVRILYARFARPVFGLGMRLLGSSEAAEELVQDVFLTAWRKAERYDPARGRLSTWLMVIAHNLGVDRLRRRSGRGEMALEGIEEVAEIPIEEERTLDWAIAVAMLRALSVRERRLLLLAYYRGWTAREIAEADGIPVGTVKTRLRSALIKLRRVHAAKEGS
jgi:RNA polymerase sigma-70 factor, ECF subfamily